MQTKYRNVLVTCPGNALTAGPEALHQLVADLNRLGQAASIVYFPFDKKFETPDPYKKYGVPVALFEDNNADLIIFPEIVTTYALKVKKATAAIWWMSVNNYTCNRYGNPLRDKFRYFKNLVRGLRPLGGIKSLRHLQHFAQSYYALDFLNSHGIKGALLSDPIPTYTSAHYLNTLNSSLNKNIRENLILYNPKKGYKVVSALMQSYPQWKFFPLEGFNREQLAEKFLSSKIYIDFGHHPGKDRLPREAGIHGCCVITGMLGSAENERDVNIPRRYKFNQNSKEFISEFGKEVNDIFDNYEICATRFTDYRETISVEQAAFDQQVRAIFSTESSYPPQSTSLPSAPQYQK
jgi:hypothetical protein